MVGLTESIKELKELAIVTEDKKLFDALEVAIKCMEAIQYAESSVSLEMDVENNIDNWYLQDFGGIKDDDN